jgi:serine/threonine protein kinase
MPELIADRYELREIIGQGASGVVVEAVDRRLGRLVALKMMRGRTSTEEHQRMLREVQVSARLNHGNLVTVHDAGMHEGLFYIVMELVIGEPLGAPMRRGEISPRQAVEIVVELLDGLAHAHARGIVHRDVKPANILLTMSENAGHGTPKLTDFGIARTEASDLTMAGTMAGTPAYMAPEQLRGEAADARADLWGLGIVLFEMLAGRHPFRPPADFFALTHAIVHRPTPALDSLVPGLPAALPAIVARATAKAATERFEDASSMAAALRAVLTSPAPWPARSAFLPPEEQEDATRRIGAAGCA